jgi:DNA-binding beta-propeller fold protein YncE
MRKATLTVAACAMLLWAGTAALLGVASRLPTACAQEEIQDHLFVTNCGTNSVLVFARTASGNTTPLRTLKGAATGLSCPHGLAVDPGNNELLVENLFADSITVYPGTASGNTTPLRTLKGAATGLSSASNLFVDPVNDELLVTEFDSPSVAAFAGTASGNTAPLRTLQGPATGLELPQAVAVDPVNNELLVVNANSITVYPRTASGDTAPLRTLQGPATGLNEPSALFVDLVNNELVVSNFADPLGMSATRSSIRVYARTADGNTAPLRVLASPELVGPLGLAVDTVNNELLVVKSLHASQYGSGSPPCPISIDAGVLVFPRTARGDICPLRTLEGNATGLDNPQFLAVTSLATPPCVGDCNNDQSVTVDELLIMVNIALGNASADTCSAGDANQHGEITIDEILTAVNNALTGCG